MAEGSKVSSPKLAAKKRRLVLGFDSESGSDLDFPFSPQLRMQNAGMAPEEIKHEGYQDFQDIVGVYGRQTDALGETLEEDDIEDLGNSTFCATCDDGGHLLFCDSPCMHSFHASEGLVKCKSIGLKEEHIEKVESWYCPNCKHGQQQCFICGQLGKSEGEDKQVFICDVALCGRFYHPMCLGDWKVGEWFNGIVDRKAFVKRVEEGDGFCCPAHSCRACGEGEEDANNKFAKCRRCPKAFHEHCLPMISLLMQQAADLVTLKDVKKVLVEPSCYQENQEKCHGHRGEIMSTLHRSLGVYLAPFVHGIRYTSFGRHFTNVGKLKEIVDRIHPYIDSGDMVVDFCCGANDFSILLNTKLIRTWKNCEFRNFDILPPKIMGLNPPFGYRASLTDKFILHALKFRPKLLVLIVPPKTMSFGERYKTFDYDLVWRDNELLKGNAFSFQGQWVKGKMKTCHSGTSLHLQYTCGLEGTC